MVAYNFSIQFAPAILARVKRGTIRMPGRRRHARPGETIQLYTGLRTKAAQLLGHARCGNATPIIINTVAQRLDFLPDGAPQYALIHPGDLHAFAQGDGFATWADMIAWFRSTYPGKDIIEGVHIGWGASFVPHPSQPAAVVR